MEHPICDAVEARPLPSYDDWGQRRRRAARGSADLPDRQRGMAVCSDQNGSTGERSSGRTAGPEEAAQRADADRRTDMTWRCYRCPQTFVHGRLLAGHLLDVHGEAR